MLLYRGDCLDGWSYHERRYLPAKLSMKQLSFQMLSGRELLYINTLHNSLPTLRHTYYNNVFSLIIEVIPDKRLKLTEVQPLERLIKRCLRAKKDTTFIQRLTLYSYLIYSYGFPTTSPQ